MVQVPYLRYKFFRIYFLLSTRYGYSTVIVSKYRYLLDRHTWDMFPRPEQNSTKLCQQFFFTFPVIKQRPQGLRNTPVASCSWYSNNTLPPSHFPRSTHFFLSPVQFLLPLYPHLNVGHWQQHQICFSGRHRDSRTSAAGLPGPSSKNSTVPANRASSLPQTFLVCSGMDQRSQ